MRGEILTYDDGPGAELISGDDGVRYRFSRSDLQQLTSVRAGMRVDFIPVDDVATEIIITSTAGAEVSPDVGVAGGMGGSLDWKTLFLDARGRIGRKDFWIGFGILLVAAAVFRFVPLIGPLICLGLIYCWICLYSKRLHDMGQSGWLAAIPIGLPFLAFAATLGATGPALILSALAVLAFALWCGVTPGQSDDNAWGPPPRALATF